MPVLAVVVTYQPDMDLLATVLNAVRPQVGGLVVVDNGSDNAQEIATLTAAMRADFHGYDHNRGIAAAQNEGVRRARRGGFSHVLLLDQDTVLGQTVVADLSRQLQNLDKAAAIGPAYHEINSKKRTRAYRADGILIRRIPLGEQVDPVATDFIIASGSLLPLDVLDKVGDFNEALFVDVVDTEWCFRARAAGFGSFISPRAVVDHRLGAGTLHVGFRRIAVHAPIRNYYWVRNALWLARRCYTPWAWRLYFISRSLGFLLLYPLFAGERATRFRLILQGIRDGLRGNLGPYERR